MKIKSDENLLEWFLINVEDGLVCINAQINVFEGPLQFSPTKRRFHPTARASVLLIEEGTCERATNKIATNKTTTAPFKKDNIHPKKRELPPKKVLLRLLMQMY